MFYEQTKREWAGDFKASIIYRFLKTDKTYEQMCRKKRKRTVSKWGKAGVLGIQEVSSSDKA